MNILKTIKDQGYIKIFWQPGNRLLDELWSDGKNKENLQKVWQEENQDLLNRLIAAEILFKKDPSFPGTDKNVKISLAQLYADALANAGTVNGNIWGLPGSIEEAGEHFLKTDRDKLIALLKSLLNNTRELTYIGSKEATYGNEYSYRVKDIAAFYISKLLNIKYNLLKTPTQRDKEIKLLLNKMAE